MVGASLSILWSQLGTLTMTCHAFIMFFLSGLLSSDVFSGVSCYFKAYITSVFILDVHLRLSRSLRIRALHESGSI